MPTSDASKKTDPRKSWSPVVVVLLLSAFFGYAILPYFSRHLAPTDRLVGTPAPDFSLPVFHGGEDTNRMSLSALLGNVVVLDFWASWCKPCVAQSRILSQIAPQYAAKKVVFVGINTADNPQNAQRFASSHDLPYPTVLDTGEVAGAYGAGSLPTLVVISPQGIISSVTVGVMGAAEIAAAIDEASAIQAPAPPS